MDLFSNLIEQLLRPPSSLHAITSYAVWCMLGIFLLAVLLRLLRLAFQFTNQASTILTSIGILGTFLGIVIGLQGVDLSNTATEESVRTLLGGMTLAFSSSLAGMTLSIVYKLLLTVPPFTQHTTDTQKDNLQVLELLQSTALAAAQQNKALEHIAGAIGAGDYSGTAELMSSMNDMIDQRLRVLNDTTVSQQRQIAQLNESMGRLVQALVEDDVQSLTGQMRGLRTELSDRHRQQNASMTVMLETFKQLSADQNRQTDAMEQVAEGQESILKTQQNTVETISSGLAGIDASIRLELGNRIDGLRDSSISAVQTLGIHLDQRLKSIGETISLHGDKHTEDQASLLTAQQTTAESINAGFSVLDSAIKEELGTRIDELRKRSELALETLGIQIDLRLEGIGESISLYGEKQYESTQATREATYQHHNDLREAWEKTDQHLLNIKTLLERSPTDEIIDALKATIREFNENISEQFGDNFSQLNDAVGRLLEWQENYRLQLGKMREQFDTSVAAVTQVSEVVGTIGGSIEQIHRHTEKIPEHMAVLGDVVQTNHTQIGILENHLGAFAETRDRAVEAMPKISEIVEGTVQGISTASEALSKAVTDSAAEIKGVTGNLAEVVNSGAQELQGAFVRSLDDYVKATDTVNTTAEGITQRTQAEVIRLYDHLQETVKQAHEDSAGRNKELISSQFENMERIRLEETEAVIKEMARALAQITGRFTDDYSKLVTAMGDIVQQAANDATR